MATTWGPGGGTHRRGERNRARLAKPRARMHHVVTTATLACRCARGSHLQGHMERVGRALTLALNQEKTNKILSGNQTDPQTNQIELGLKWPGSSRSVTGRYQTKV